MKELAEDALLSSYNEIKVEDESKSSNFSSVVSVALADDREPSINADDVPILLHQQVLALQVELKRVQSDNDHLRKEQSAHRRELANLKKTMKGQNKARHYEETIDKLRNRICAMEVEKDYFIREIRILEDKIEELEKENDDKTYQLAEYDKLLGGKPMPDKIQDDKTIVSESWNSMSFDDYIGMEEHNTS